MRLTHYLDHQSEGVSIVSFHSKNRWKTALSIFVLFVGFAGVSNTALAQNCSKNCLSVYSIQLTDLGSTIRGIVKLVDETGAGGGARGAVVHAVWTRPDGTTFDQYANIGTRLRAEFSLYTAGVGGKYTLTVAGASKPGYKFDTKHSSKLSESITVGGSGNQPPTAVANASVLGGAIPLDVNFDSSGSTDPDGGVLTFAWAFGDGGTSFEANPGHTYTNTGNFTATLTVTDDMGASASSSVVITASDSNAGCTSNCMSVEQISFAFKKKAGIITGQVSIYDETNNRVKGADVLAVWTLPDGSTVEQLDATNSRAIAKFTLNATDAGQYALTIVEVIKGGLTFDAEGSNVLTGSVDISP